MSFIRTLTTTYVSNKARKQGNGTGLMGFGIGVIAARLATRSIPGALLVGGAIVTKALYDRSKEKAAAKVKRLPAPDQMIEIEDNSSSINTTDSVTDSTASAENHDK